MCVFLTGDYDVWKEKKLTTKRLMLFHYLRSHARDSDWPVQYGILLRTDFNKL